MSKPPIKRVLIANRGEIAVRIARTLRDMAIESVAVYSDADRLAPHVALCDMAVHIGAAAPSCSYLNQAALLRAALLAKADAIHPGYGFLAENSEFAQAVLEAGLIFVGPPPAAIEAMGTKTAARAIIAQAGVPTVPGTGDLLEVEVASRAAAEMGYPVMLKAAAGGGGKGMRLVESAAQLAGALRATRSEANNAFGNPSVYMEKAIEAPRHIEIQIFADHDGHVVFLGERECSMQRRHQKMIEECPAPSISAEHRQRMGEVACQAARAVGYVGAGTVEFIVDQSNRFYFLEMNTRLQVEHPVTELCFGVDLVAAQLQVAAQLPLPWQQTELQARGWAMEVRLCAEDPQAGFMPAPGLVERLHWPAGPGIRVDAGVVAGYAVPSAYDPMIGKIIAYGANREQTRQRLLRALRETLVKGIATNLTFLQRLLDCPAFVSGRYHTGVVATVMEQPPPALKPELTTALLAATAVHAWHCDQQQSLAAPPERLHGWGRAMPGPPLRGG